MANGEALRRLTKVTQAGTSVVWSGTGIQVADDTLGSHATHSTTLCEIMLFSIRRTQRILYQLSLSSIPAIQF